MNSALKKQSLFFTGAVYFLLCCFAISFYFERLNSDAGYYFFHTINTRCFHVEHGRLVLILAELLPALGSIMHLPLKFLAVLYSLNHVFFPAILTAICITKYKNFNAGILITFLQFAGLKYAVFTPQFELFYGLSLIVFCLSYANYIDSNHQKWSIKNYIIFCLLLVFVFSSHPMAIYCYFACITLFFCSKKYLNIIGISIAFLISYTLWKYLFISDYEASKFNNFTTNFNSTSGALQFNFHFFKSAFTFLFRHYPDILFILIAGVINFIKNRQFAQLAFYLAFTAGSLIIIWLMFPPDNMGRYIEQVYFPFVFLACLWLFKSRLNQTILICLFLVLGFRIYLITDNAIEQKKRSEQIAKFSTLAQIQNGSKFYVTEKQMGKELYAQGNWSYGFETMLYSAIHCRKTVTITKEEDLEYNKNDKNLKPDEFLFRPFDIFPDKALNRQYFNMTEGSYILLK